MTIQLCSPSILFDWSDIVMDDDPSMTISMVEWEKVEILEGIGDAVETAEGSGEWVYTATASSEANVKVQIVAMDHPSGTTR